MSGRGTSAGVVFQGEVGAYLAGLLLAERPLSRLTTGLPGTPKKLLFETLSAVDDIVIETNCGEVYVQAKRTLSLSNKSDSELASVADQFVRQFRAGVIENGSPRSMQPARDRLVLAVGPETAATVTTDLKEALDRNRTGAATGLPNHLAKALQVFTELIKAAWLREVGLLIDAVDTQSILSLSSVIVIADSQRQVVEECIQNIVASTGEETLLIDLLRVWAEDCAARGLGGDAVAIRLSLLRKIKLTEPPSFRSDIRSLSTYSATILERLKRFTTIATPEGRICIGRTVSNFIVEAAQTGSLAITGEAGTGKSAILYQLAHELSKQSLVITMSVEAGITSLDMLRQEIGVKHPIVEVMKQMTSDNPSYLLIDSLDAVRGGQAETTYKRLVEDISFLSNWTIIASIRTFDLRMGNEWRRLFKGIPPFPAHSDHRFPTVRHLHISLLNDDEMAQIATQSPSLGIAMEASGKKMEALARNPFNLVLLSDLLKGEIPAKALAAVASRGELLERYWDERVTNLGTAATVSLKRMISLMIAAKSVDIPEAETPFSAAATVDELQKVGVLVNGQNRRIGFRHHVLFDYAVSRLILEPDQAIAFNHLNKISGAGMLLAPSLGYWLENLKKKLPFNAFWGYIVALLSDEKVDPIIRIEVARIAIESVQEEEDLSALGKVFGPNDPSTKLAFIHLIGSLITKLTTKQPIQTEPWCLLLSKITTSEPHQLGYIQALVGALLKAVSSLQAMHGLGIASRMLFDTISKEDYLISRFAPFIIHYVARTYGTDPVASRQRLEKIFVKERFDRFGHLEVPNLANEVVWIAEFDPDLVIQLYHCQFHGGNFSQSSITPMSSSWILSFTSNAAQDFSLGEYALTEAFPTLLLNFPRTGVRALAAAFRGAREKTHPASETDQTTTFVLDGEQILFENDIYWGWDLEDSEHNNSAKLHQAFMEWIENADSELLREVPLLVLRETGTSIIWHILFTAALRKPETLGKQLWSLAAAPVVLQSWDTRQSALDLIAAVYPQLSIEQRQHAEEKWLEQNPSYVNEWDQKRLDLLKMLFEGIGEKHLATNQARAYVNNKKRERANVEKERDFREHPSGERASSKLEYVNGEIKVKEANPLQECNNGVKVAKDYLQENPSPEAINEFWDAIVLLDKTFAHTESNESPLEPEVSSTLAEEIGFALIQNYVPKEMLVSSLERLLILTHHPIPETTTNTEETFSRFPGWQSPAPRVKAAKSLADLINHPVIRPQIQERFETMLFNDPHPAVRLQMVLALDHLEADHKDNVWTLLEKFVTQETNPTLIKYSARVFSKLLINDAQRVEPLILELAKRLEPDNDNVITDFIMFFAINKNFAESQAIIHNWIENYSNREKCLSKALYYVRDALTTGLDSFDSNKNAIRKRTQEFIRILLLALEPSVRSWPLWGREPKEEEIVAVKLFDRIADQLYFSLGYKQPNPELACVEAQRLFLTEYALILSTLSTLGSPKAVHRTLEILEKLIPVDPILCFDLFSEAMLRTTGVAPYEHEPMGAKLFVSLISLYLADYRAVFSDDIRRGKLIDCLDVFVKAGWPESRQLFESLPELLQ